MHGNAFQFGANHGGIHFHVAEEPAAGAGGRPDQVPPLTFRFVNRVEDLSALEEWCAGVAGAGSYVGIGVLSGLPGVGKTSTACRSAERVRGLFPDGQLFVDFRELRERTGGDVSEAVAEGLRALGVDDVHIPAALAERTKDFRSRTAGRRLLVLLDDVTQPAQVRPLIPKGAGSVVLVTSNATLDELELDGARLMPLAPVDTERGLHMLAEWCGEKAVAAEPDAAGRLVGLCGGLPVALRVAALRLRRTRGAAPLGALAGELADEARRLPGLALRGERSVSAVFEVAYRDLPPDTARLYRLLGWLPGPAFDAGTVAAAAALEPAAAGELLAELESVSLLERLDDGRYRCHDLVRLHARERADAEEPADGRRALVERVTRHCLVLTALADRAVRKDRLRIHELPGGGLPDPFAADGGPRPLAWLEAERATLLAVLREAARYGLHEQVWQLAEAFTVLFLHRRHLADWRESLELGAAAAAEAGLPAAEARLRSLLSRPLMDLGRHEEARAALERAVACADVAGHTVLSASVQEFYGRYWDRFDPSRAVRAYRRSLELNLAGNEPRGAAIAAYFLGCAQDAGGDPRTALETLRGAHEAFLALAEPDRRMAARVAVARGLAHDHAGEAGEAVRELGEAVLVLREVGAAHYEAQALVELARLTERTGGDGETVRAYVARACEIHEAGGSPSAGELREWLGRLG
ncbi:hypothetical protein ACFP1Z_17805 [Streptomyces gamaensis]|uniref:NB-ARC domain-containing protein n=1 Tax=Streptomyces gamaensis TaxID=1763542 RepID=A0ABW0Z253_9ACTN